MTMTATTTAKTTKSKPFLYSKREKKNPNRNKQIPKSKKKLFPIFHFYISHLLPTFS